MDWHFPRRALADDIMDGFINRGQKAYLLFERRRMGKTSFLQRDLSEAARKRNWIPLYATFFESSVSGESLLVHELHKAVERRQIKLPTGALKKIEAAGLGGVEFYERKDQTKTNADQNTLSVLDDLIGVLCQHDPLLLLLDEIQDVVRHKNSEAFLKQLRSSIDKRPGQIAAVFTGSSMVGLNRIFDDRRRAFFGFATRLPFPEFGEAFIEHCRTGYKKRLRTELPKKEAEEAFSALDGVTGHFRRYVEVRLMSGVDHETALNSVLSEFREDFRLLNQWLGLEPGERAMLSLIQTGISGPYKEQTRIRFAEITGLNEVPERTVLQQIIRKLRRKGLIDQDEETKIYFVADPRFAEFIESRKR